MSEHTSWKYGRLSYLMLSMAIFASVVVAAVLLLALVLAGVGFFV